ncbi:MAG: DUF547 domain-containing protein [Bacteroidota bacterium]
MSAALFSRELKIQKLKYQFGEPVDHDLIEQHLAALEKIDLNALNSDELKKSFWINCYNGLTNYWIIHFNIQHHMREVVDIFKKPRISVDAWSFSLDDIEHGILRQNARPQFTQEDERRQFMVNQLDYRIHFALNCGAQSCPPLAYYDDQQIEQQLQMAESSFVENAFLVNEQKQQIHCSSLFEWYREDFSSVYLNDPQYENYKVILMPYDWSI